MQKLMSALLIYFVTMPVIITVPVRVYRVENVVLSDADIEIIIADVSQIWSSQSQISLQLLSIENATNIDIYRSTDAIDIYFMNDLHASGIMIGNKIFINTNDDYFPIEQIIAHELGHIFGLEHQATGLMASDESLILSQSEIEIAQEYALKIQ